MPSFPDPAQLLLYCVVLRIGIKSHALEKTDIEVLSLQVQLQLNNPALSIFVSRHTPDP